MLEGVGMHLCEELFKGDSQHTWMTHVTNKLAVACWLGFTSVPKKKKKNTVSKNAVLQGLLL